MTKSSTAVTRRVLAMGPTGLDIHVHLPQLRSEGSSSPLPIKLSAGGACRNLAVNLATLGADATLLTQDYGKSLENAGIKLTRHISEKLIRTSEENKGSMGIFVAAIDNNDIVASVGEYEFAKTVFTGRAGHELSEFIQGFDILVTCSDVSRDFWNNVKSCSQQDGRQLTCLTTSGFPLPEDYLMWLVSCDLVFINSVEAELLGFGPEAFCNEAIKRGAKSVFVTLGSEGAAYYCRKGAKPKRRTAPNLPGRVTAPVGAGDAFAAGVIYGVMLKYDLSKAVDLGLLIAAKHVRQNEYVITKMDGLEGLAAKPEVWS